MHKDISVAVPTRHRPECIEKFLKSYNHSLFGRLAESNPHITILLDSPEEKSMPSEWNCNSSMQKIKVFDKSSLTELWNLSIITSPTDWVLICNDDIVFKRGWLEYLEKTIATGKYLQINLGHYGAFCLHKSLILKIGWHDERYRGGGYEDIDWQLRLNEAGLKDSVDTSHDFHTNNPGHDVGHFIDHFKNSSNEGWQGENNEQFICVKWGRRGPVRWNQIPSIRQVPERDTHPTQTMKYAKKFKAMPSYVSIDAWTSVWGKVGEKEVYP